MPPTPLELCQSCSKAMTLFVASLELDTASLGAIGCLRSAPGCLSSQICVVRHYRFCQRYNSDLSQFDSTCMVLWGEFRNIFCVMESVLVSFFHSDAVMAHQADLMHALAQVCQVRQQTTHGLAPLLILVPALLESSMPISPALLGTSVFEVRQ